MVLLIDNSFLDMETLSPSSVYISFYNNRDHNDVSLEIFYLFLSAIYLLSWATGL